MKCHHVLPFVAVLFGICGVQLHLAGSKLFTSSFYSSSSSSSTLRGATLETELLQTLVVSSTRPLNTSGGQQQQDADISEEHRKRTTTATTTTTTTFLNIPADGPDPRMATKVMSAFENSVNATNIQTQIAATCGGITSQVQLVMSNNDDERFLWTLQALNEQGQPKTVGGDEFYISFTSSQTGPYYPLHHRHHQPRHEGQKLWPDEPDHPTAVALITDHRNGTYTLDFVRSPMSPDSQTNDMSLQGGQLTIHFVYSCGIGEMAPPSKEDWTTGGAIQVAYTVNIDRGPPIRPFDRPRQSPAVPLDDFDFVLFVGDSLMGQFTQHKGVMYHSNIFRGAHSLDLNTATVQGFVDAVESFAKAVLKQQASIQKLGVVVGSSTWDILADTLGQGVDFADHAVAVRTYITQLRERLGQLGLETPPTVLWKSATAVHAHVVVDRRTKYFGAPSAALKRIKYMSSFRSDTLYALQGRIMNELQVPVLDVYHASFLSGDWHFPTDGRHYRPEFNQFTFNWFYANPEDVGPIDYTFNGYGVEWPMMKK